MNHSNAHPLTPLQQASLAWLLEDLSEPAAAEETIAIPVLTADSNEADCADYTLHEGPCWVTVANLSIHIVPTDEGVVLSVYPKDHEMSRCIAVTEAFFDQALAGQFAACNAQRMQSTPCEDT